MEDRTEVVIGNFQVLNAALVESCTEISEDALKCTTDLSATTLSHVKAFS